MTMTQGWMVGIIGLMVVFGICALIFWRLGNKKENK